VFLGLPKHLYTIKAYINVMRCKYLESGTEYVDDNGQRVPIPYLRCVVHKMGETCPKTRQPGENITERCWRK
jgi:hypothetical protein